MTSLDDIQFLYTVAEFIMEETNRNWELDEEPLDLREFVNHNYEAFQWDTFLRVFSLKEGQTVTFGGGAAAKSVVKRIR